MDPADPARHTGFWGPKIAVTLLGGAFFFVSVILWSLEGNEGYHLHLDKDGHPIEDDAHATHAGTH